MAYKTWKVIEVRYCDRAGEEVSLDTQVVYPAEWLPEQPPRVQAHRCSRALSCNLFNKPACSWSATNPGYDPYGGG